VRHPERAQRVEGSAPLEMRNGLGKRLPPEPVSNHLTIQLANAPLQSLVNCHPAIRLW